jgi:hypothetical protein
MDEEHPEQRSEADSMDEESTYLMLKTFSPPKPSHSPLTDDPGATSASAPSNAGGESSSKSTVTSAIRKGLTEGLRSGLFQFFGQGTTEQNREYHARETERSETIIQDEQHTIAAIRLQRTETKREQARVRKQKQRGKTKSSEIQFGLRSPGGRKHRVSDRSIISQSTH